MEKLTVELYCDCCGTRIDGVTFFNVILGVVYHYHDECYEREVVGGVTGEDHAALSRTPNQQ